MARVALPKVETSGVYAHLLRYFEADLQTWVDNIGNAHWPDAPYPRQRILDDLRAGRAVNVPTYALPRSAMKGSPSRPGPPILHGRRRGHLSVIRPGRAIVTPDDQITYTDDDRSRLSLEEDGL